MRTRDRSIILIHDFTEGHEYQVKVCAVDSTGRIQKEEDSLTGSIVIEGKTDTPASVSTVTTSVQFLSIVLSWTNPSDRDFAYMEIWRASINLFPASPGGAELIATVKGNTFYDFIGSTGATRYYWLRAVNTSGKKSAYNPTTETTTISATTASIKSAEIASLSADKITAGTIDASVITVTNLNADNITAGTLTGRTVQTAVSGQRVVIAAADNTIRMHTATESNVILADDNLFGQGPGISITSATSQFRLIHPTTGNFYTWLMNGTIVLANPNSVGLIRGIRVTTSVTAAAIISASEQGAGHGMLFVGEVGSPPSDVFTVNGDGDIYASGDISADGEVTASDKIKLTALGGYAIKVTNKTGSSTVAGQLVKADTVVNDAFARTSSDDAECIGIVLDSGVADGSEAWIVVAGVANVAMKDNTAAARGNWVKVSDEIGYADATLAAPPGGGIPELDEHMREIGHCIEAVSAGGGGTHILARCVISFN